MGDSCIIDNTEESKKEDERKSTEEQVDQLQTANGSSTTSNGTRRPLDLSLGYNVQTSDRVSKKRKQDYDKTSSSAHEAATRLPTTSYFHGLGSMSPHYGNLLASAEFGNGSNYSTNPYMTGAGFNFSLLSGADRNRLSDMSMKRFEGDLLTKRLFQIDVRAIRQLVASYRDAAALLIRTADELELFASTKH
uniref:Uncharacterized protein n=1 Tax=Trichuris muris TaxID=70415 RepID=A0A5S6Q8A4_TRIMR